MKQKLRLLMLTLLCAVVGTAWGQTTTGTIYFGNNGTKINSASVTGNDSQGNGWTITTEGTTSFTQSSDYSQVGSSSKPASRITFTTTLPAEKNITAFSAKFGGFSNTAGTVTLKVGNTTVGTGSLSGTSDVTVSSTSEATGTVLTVTVTGISKGVKCYNISYTYTDAQPQTGDKYYVAGSWTDWQNGKIQMTKRSDGSYTLTNQQLAADAEFKIIKEAEGETELVWYGGDTNDQYYWVTPDNHTDMSLIVKSGEYANFQIKNAGTWTFTVDLSGDTPKITVDGNWPVWEYYLYGDFNQWATNASYKLDDAGNGKYTLNKPIKFGEKFKIKGIRGSEEKWYGADSSGDFYVNSDHVGISLSLKSPGDNFYMNLSNKLEYWSLEFDPANMTLVLSNYLSDIATLPFEFDGGRNAIQNTPGLSTTGLGSDYDNSPKLKFTAADNALVLHFNERPGTLSYDIKGNGFSGGTFEVQTSEDGDSYTTLKTYTSISGATNGQHETFENLGENVRYIKWLYKQKSSGNVALGNIKLEKYVAPQSYTLNITENENAEIFVFYNDQYNNYPAIENGNQVLATSEVLVSVSVKDDEVYQIESVTVTDGNGQAVTLTEKEEGISWTFTMPNSSVTVACTVTEIPEPSEEEWVLTDLADLTEDDIFVIVGNNGDNYALPNGLGSTPSAISVFVVNNKIVTDVDDNLKWNISGNATDGYIFYPNGDTENWLYLKDKSTNKGVFVGTGVNNLFTLEDGYLYNEATERYVGIYNSSDWRCYTSTSTNIANQTFGFYKLVKNEPTPVGEPFEFTINSRAADDKYYYATIADLGEGCFEVVGDMEVRTVTIVDGKISYPKTYYKGEIFPGNGAYLVVADKETTDPGKHTFPAVAGSAPVPVDNMLYSSGEGNLSADDMAAAHENCIFYKLSLNQNHEKVGFYWGAEDGKAFPYTKHHQAYLAVPKTTGQGAAAYFFDGDATGIYNVKATEVESINNTTYTISGMRMENNQLPKGIYIKNGKKVVVR